MISSKFSMSQLNFNQKRCTPKYWVDFSRHVLKLELRPGCKIERKPASVNCFVSHRTCQRPMRINETLENIQTCPKADSDQMLLRCRETLFLFNFQCRKTYHTFSACFFPTCQVRVVRFYESCFAFFFFLFFFFLLFDSSSFSLPDINCQLTIAVDNDRLCTATASCLSVYTQCLYRTVPIGLGSAGPQPTSPQRCGKSWTSTARSDVDWAVT